jgi:hypothetical protein
MGRTQLIDLPRSGDPRDTGKVNSVHALIEGEGYLSEEKIAQMLGSYCETVTHIWRDDLSIR